MAKSTFFLLIYAAIIVVVRADGLSDFSNNLASDLGPLLSLFGDAVTRQYLSGSTTFIDYFIFAMAPIGIIGTITAVIRVCGSSSLRAFIGRAQEGQGTIEAELSTSTSAQVCELFNKGGIARVLGRSDIIELLYISDGRQTNKNQQKEQKRSQPKLHLFISYLEDSLDECWQRTGFSGSGNAVLNKIGPSEYFPDLAPTPNLSLNVAVRRQPDWVFNVIALVGFILQAGILVFAGIAGWLLEWNRQKPNSEASRNYAPGIFIAGTITLCVGVWSCAALIGQTTYQQYFRRSPESSDMLYWIQPGSQVIGDQSFGSFAYSDLKGKDRPMIWISSTKVFDKNLETVTYFAVSLVLFGYIAQFIGLRGLNAWISITQLGINIIMSILRGILSTKRLYKNNNLLDMWQDLVTGHELDWLALDIAGKELTKKLKTDVQDTSVENDPSQKFEKELLWFITGQHEKAIGVMNATLNDSGSETLEISLKNEESNHNRKSDLSNEWLVAYNDELIQNRTRLSNLTGHFGESMDAKGYLSWKDERVRVRAKAKSLGVMISQAAAILLRNQSNKEDIHLRIKAAFSYAKSNGEETIVSIKLKSPTGPDRINWGVDSSQLEAILGLWLWSITRQYARKISSRNIASLPNKILNSKIFRVVSACYGEHEWDNSFDTDMSLWLGSSDLKYVKQSLDMLLYNSYKYTLADHWIPSDENSVIGDQDTIQTTKEDNESKNYRRVGESTKVSTAGPQRFCGWNLIYDVLNTATSEKDSSYTPEMKRVNVKGFWVKDAEHSLLDICAQELFVALLHSMKALEFRKLDKISVSESGGNIRLENPVISALAKCFTDNGLGTHSDAISCLIPSLRSEIPPYQEKMLSESTTVASNYRRDEEWSIAEVVLSWACQYHHKLSPADTDETSNFMVALRELGELYRWSLAQMQHNARQEFGARGIAQMASKFGTTNPIVALYSTVAERINGTRIKSQEWMDGFHHAVKDRRRADALYYLCYVGNFIPHKLGKCLPLAARNGWEEIVSALLEMKLSPDIKDDDGRTMVSHCAELGLQRSLRRSMDMNADLDLVDKHKMTPLAYAAMNGHENIVRMLIETGQVDLKGSGDSIVRSPLWLAIDQDHFSTIAELLDKGVDFNMKNYTGDRPLGLAIRRGNSGVIKLLLEYSSPKELEHRNLKPAIEQLLESDSGITGPELSKTRIHPLIWAAWRGYTDVMRLLLEDYSALIPAGGDETREAKKLLARGSILQPLRNHSDGFFSTLDVPPLPSTPDTDMYHIKFHPPYSEAPRLMIGISGLWVEKGSPLDMHWEASPVSETGFTLIRRYDYGREPVDSTNVTWIEFGTEEQEFQVGNFSSSEDFNDDDVGDDYHLEEGISFQNAFKQEPNVVVWLRGLSHVRKSDNRWTVSARPDKITANGFKIGIGIRNGDRRKGFRAAWLAYPADSMHIQSGTFSLEPSYLNTIQRQEFTKKFGRIPRVFSAFSELGISGNEEEKIEVKILQIDATGFSWSSFDLEPIAGWVRRRVYAKVQWVAFG